VTIALAVLAGGLVGALLVGIVLRVRAERLRRRADALLEVARRYELGDWTRPSPDYADDELGRVARGMDLAVREVARRHDALAADRARMEAILGSMVEGVLVVDGQGRLQLVNDAARRMLKLDRDATGRTYLESIRHPAIVDQIGRVLSGQPAESLDLSLAQDPSRTLVARVGPVVAAGRGAVLVLHDITDLRKADQIRRDFVANVSHELRTPLTAVKGYAEALLEDKDETDDRYRFVETIHRQATRMERLVTDLLRLARLDAGQELLVQGPCDVARLIADVVADFEPLISAKRLRFETAVDERAQTISTDESKLHDVLRNLVENAVSYTPDGGAVHIAVRRLNDDVELTVRDSGPGIPPNDLTRVFERFYGVDKSRARPGGTGLGLAIVKHLVHVINGEVRAENRPEGGAVFTVMLRSGHRDGAGHDA
jgi:two-component system phosphate regulon sensor histidine kinase PhoR